MLAVGGGEEKQGEYVCLYKGQQKQYYQKVCQLSS